MYNLLFNVKRVKLYIYIATIFEYLVDRFVNCSLEKTRLKFNVL